MTPEPPERPGFLRGLHDTSYVGDVERLVRSSSAGVAAERLLLELLTATEAAARLGHQGVAPWYYAQLANVYQRRGDEVAERAILVRFCAQRAAPGPIRRVLLARLRTLKASAARLTPSGATRPPPPVRLCALPGCVTPLTATQAKSCTPAHSGAAKATGPPAPTPRMTPRPESR